MKKVYTSILLLISFISFAQNSDTVLFLHNRHVANALAFHNNTIWVGTNGGGLYQTDLNGSILQSFTVENSGIPYNSVNEIKFYGDTLWLATNNGLGKFDGTNWTTYNTSNKLLGNIISDIDIDKNGNIWMSIFQFGLFQFRDSVIKSFTKSTGFKSNDIGDISIDDANNVWVVLETGEFTKITSDTIEYIPSSNVGYFRKIKAKDHNSIYALSGTGVYSYINGVWTTTNLGNSTFQAQLFDICFDNSGAMWLSSYDGIITNRSGNWEYLKNGYAYEGNYVNTIIADSKNTIWLGTYCGVISFTNSKWQNYPLNVGIISDYVNSMTQSTDGTYWFGTSNGLGSYSKQIWNGYYDGNSIYNQSVWSVMSDSTNLLWIGKTCDNITTIKDGVRTVLDSIKDFNGASINCIVQDKKQNYVFGTSKGLLIYNGKTWKTFSYIEFPDLVDIKDISFTSDNTYWILSYYKGLIKFDGNVFTLYNNQNGFPYIYPQAIEVDSNDNIWVVGSDPDINHIKGAVGKFNGTTWTQYDCDNQGYHMFNLQDIAFDKKGHMWITSSGSSLYEYDGVSFRNISKDILFYSGFSNIFIDSYSNKWLSSYGALVIYNENGINYAYKSGISGDKNGDSIISGDEIAGDNDGNGIIDNNELAGDVNGDSKILYPEIIGDIDGDYKIDNNEIAGDFNGNHIIDANELVNKSIILTKNDIIIFPVNNSVAIKSDEQNTILSVFVADISGRALLNMPNISSNYIELLNIPRGINFITVKTPNFSITKKFVKE